MTPHDKPITILVTALGGEGGGVLAEWLVDTAARAGHSVQSTSIPGVAQRTGATTYYVEVFPVPERELGGRRPVFSLNPVPGALDLLVSSELLETVRQIGNGMTTPARTHVLTSTSRSLTVAEKMQLGDGRLADAELLRIVQAQSREAEAFDMAARGARERHRDQRRAVRRHRRERRPAASRARPTRRRSAARSAAPRRACAASPGPSTSSRPCAPNAAPCRPRPRPPPRRWRRAATSASTAALAAFPADLHDILALGWARARRLPGRAATPASTSSASAACWPPSAPATRHARPASIATTARPRAGSRSGWHSTTSSASPT